MARIESRRCDICQRDIHNLDGAPRLVWCGLVISLAAVFSDTTTAEPVSVDWCETCQRAALTALAKSR